MYLLGRRAADVIVVGSGAAGLCAAVSAHDSGARVLLLERSNLLGGTSAMSGGVSWIPDNHLAQQVGSADSFDHAVRYLEAVSLGMIAPHMARTYVEQAPKVLRYLEAATPLKFRALRMPDYHPEHEGGTYGRSVEPLPVPVSVLGELQAALRASPHIPIPFSQADLEDGRSPLDTDLLGARLADGLVTSGRALVAGLLRAVLDRGIELRRNVRVRGLLADNGRVAGVEAETERPKLERLRATRGVILATGGYEWNRDLCSSFLRGPLEAAMSPPTNEGDGLLMAMEHGAALDNMSEALWMPASHIPGEAFEGHPLFRMNSAERKLPGSIMVNRAGRRFVNECHNYNDVGRVLHDFDAVAFEFRNLPAWIVIHQGVLAAYPFLTSFPGDPAPPWLVSAPTLRELAAKIGVDGAGLEETVARFNVHAAVGRDPDFRRGESVYDHYAGDRSRSGAARTLAPLDTPPFYAIQVHAGSLGTKGGPKTSANGEVLNVRGEIVRGLYAAGNCAASFMGRAYPGAGSTLGPALTFGHLAGVAAAANHRNRT